MLSRLLMLLTIAGFQSVAIADDGHGMAAPQAEHAWLQKFVGEWTMTMSSEVPGQPAFESTGTISGRSVGGMWVLNEMSGDAGGVSFTGLQTIGYAPAEEAYVGTWIDSVTTHLWHYRGQVSDDGTTITLEAEGPDMTGSDQAGRGKTRRYRDVYEFRTDNEMTFSSRVLNEDGSWTTFMKGTARRKP